MYFEKSISLVIYGKMVKWTINVPRQEQIYNIIPKSAYALSNYTYKKHLSLIFIGSKQIRQLQQLNNCAANLYEKVIRHNRKH